VSLCDRMASVAEHMMVGPVRSGPPNRGAIAANARNAEGGHERT
jgi:hypothetical protein